MCRTVGVFNLKWNVTDAHLADHFKVSKKVLFLKKRLVSHPCQSCGDVFATRIVQNDKGRSKVREPRRNIIFFQLTLRGLRDSGMSNL